MDVGGRRPWSYRKSLARRKSAKDSNGHVIGWGSTSGIGTDRPSGDDLPAIHLFALGDSVRRTEQLLNKLPTSARAQALHMMVEGSSMRSISRVLGISFGAVAKLLRDAGAACLEYHDRAVRGLNARNIEADEIWSFCFAKARNAGRAKGVIDHAGDVWTWTAIDRDSKLMISLARRRARCQLCGQVSEGPSVKVGLQDATDDGLLSALHRGR